MSYGWFFARAVSSSSLQKFARLIAQRCLRAAQQLGTAISAQQVVLIGDTPADVEAALAWGAYVIAVASGTYEVKDLHAAGAETALPSLSNLAQLREALTF